MEFKGTKGEWEFVEYHSGELIGVRVISDSENENIFDTGLRGYIDNEMEANYKLSSCAPEMLKLLNKLHLLLEEHQPNWYLLGHHNEILELRKKATII